MFLILSSFVSSTIDECVAPREYNILDVPGKTFKLKYVSILTRHGARSPLDPFLEREKRGAWRCDAEDAQATHVESNPLVRPRRIKSILDHRFAEYPPNCKLGDLIIDGMNQHRLLGQKLREYYYEKMHFIPEYYDPTVIYARCTAYDRTFRSAISFLSGLYEPADPNEVAEITMGSPSLDSLRPKKEFCQDFKDLAAKYFNSQGFIDIYMKTLGEIKPVIDYLNVTDTSFAKIDKVCDWVTTMFCNDQYMPPEITSDMITTCRRFQGTMLYGLYGSDNATRGVAFSYGLREVLSHMDSYLNGESTHKFVLLSAHDSTVAALLSTLGYSHEFIPPLASHVALEVYSEEATGELYIRFVFNGQPVKLLLMDNQELVKLDSFRHMIDPLINHCREMP